MVNFESFFHKNLVMIHMLKEEFHKYYYEDDMLDQVNLDLIDQLLSKIISIKIPKTNSKTKYLC